MGCEGREKDSDGRYKKQNHQGRPAGESPSSGPQKKTPISWSKTSQEGDEISKSSERVLRKRNFFSFSCLPRGKMALTKGGSPRKTK